MPRDLPPHYTVYQRTQRLLWARVFEATVADLRALTRLGEGKSVDPPAAIVDCRTLHGSVENGDWCGDDGHKRKNGTNLHLVTFSTLMLARMLTLLLAGSAYHPVAAGR